MGLGIAARARRVGRLEADGSAQAERLPTSITTPRLPLASWPPRTQAPMGPSTRTPSTNIVMYAAPPSGCPVRTWPTLAGRLSGGMEIRDDASQAGHPGCRRSMPSCARSASVSSTTAWHRRAVTESTEAQVADRRPVARLDDPLLDGPHIRELPRDLEACPRACALRLPCRGDQPSDVARLHIGADGTCSPPPRGWRRRPTRPTDRAVATSSSGPGSATLRSSGHPPRPPSPSRRSRSLAPGHL